MAQTRLNARTATMTSEMDGAQKSAIQILANELRQLNRAVMIAVETGLSVELQRTAGHNAEGRYWGDLLMPSVVQQK